MEIRACPHCLHSYRDITQNYCLKDGVLLSSSFKLPIAEDEGEAETMVRRPNTVQVNSAKLKPKNSKPDPPKRRTTNPKEFLTRNYPELLHHKRRSSRMWESSEKSIYQDNWWFGLMASELARNQFIVFAGALDHANQDFKIFKVPTDYLRDNLSKIDITSDGWINLYIHMRDYVDVRNDAALSFRQFIIN